jgi:YesN/AraC family two-component response regulator
MYALHPDDDQGALLELDYLMKPLAPDQLTAVLEQQRDQDDASPAARTILVVDDDPDIRALHTRLIRQHQPQCRVLQAGNGREALALLEQERPNLVLLDLMMTDLDGFGVLAAMRERPALRDVPVVVLTAQTLTEDDMVRLNTGVAAILSKSLFTADEILHQIEATLGHQRKLGSAMQLVVRRAVAFIQAHYQEALTRDQLAEHLAISADHLTASFRQEMGVTPIAYLNRYRISRACGLLAETGRSITDIAIAVGFTDHPSFSRLFHREMGRTPHAFRREKQQPA